MISAERKGVSFAVGAALLFGLSTPLAKILLGSVSPHLLAGLFYLGSGIGLGMVLLGRTMRSGTGGAREAPLRLPDLPWLGGAILSGGIAGPVLLMAGLSITPASAASLLLNLEGVFTALLAWFAFRENFDRRIALGMAAIVAGGCLLSWDGAPGWGGLAGPLAIAGACLAWGIDNNLTGRISGGDPVQIACLKGLVAGLVNGGLAWGSGASLPGLTTLASALIVGFFGYGLSLVLFVLGLRHLGTARTGAYFSLAPFIGSGVALLLLREPLSASFIAAALLMGGGIWLHLTERHEHPHAHGEMEHEHWHEHDAHHQHGHPPGMDPRGPHSHPHRHEPLVHSHPHYPDLHHRHRH
ncbi:MAG: DMT family transporter [Candidatus Tectomicrobia bacterium]|uniref:DMT family transporter n=1 Tax=Tectimicrobiota bacterium TaxID=2528274 RepID=A0A932HYA6_UNCTE|nr:DMT family transporter [Candidatus Tectomicrobia bacterium]